MDKFFLVQIKRTKDVIEKGVVVKDTLDAAKQSYHAYLGAYAFGNNKDTDYVNSTPSRISGGGYYSAERRQALGQGLSPRSPKGGQRRREEVTPRG